VLNEDVRDSLEAQAGSRLQIPRSSSKDAERKPGNCQLGAGTLTLIPGQAFDTREH
jgi:hypothetical protein